MHALEAKVFYLFGFLPFPPGLVIPWVILLVLAGAAAKATRHMTVIPGSWQNGAEWVCENLRTFVVTITGPKHAAELTPILSTMFLYVFLANMAGLVPGLKSPSGMFTNALAMALVTFLMTHYLGFRHQGLGYLKHFWGDVWWLGPLMLPLHIIGELARPVSLTLRLFGNIMGEDVVILVLTIYLFPFIVPLPMMLMGLFTSLLQALVFTILSGLYLSGALASHH